MLFPEHGDDIGSYETIPATANAMVRALVGEDRRQLAHKENGDCFYLGENGCTIWDRAPVMCKSFDCRLWFAKYSRQERRELLAKGFADRDVVNAGKERLHTLTPEERRASKFDHGEMAERLKASLSKSERPTGLGGSNPSLTAK